MKFSVTGRRLKLRLVYNIRLAPLERDKNVHQNKQVRVIPLC